VGTVASSTQHKKPFDIRLLIGLFFLSGASSLIVETVLSRLLTYTFGNTTQAVSTVLAAFLGGLALGAFCFGLWVDRWQPTPWIYAGLEAAVGLYAAFIPKMFTILTAAYVHICHQFVLGQASLTALRFGLASIVILPASFLMGGTLPAISRYIASRDVEFTESLDSLYSWNTLGAAFGTLLSTYVLIPVLGIMGAIYLACGTNLFIFICAGAIPKLETHAKSVESDSFANAPLGSEISPLAHSRNFLLLGAFFTGAAALGYEVIWAHVQAFTIGSTVYAFGVTLFVVLCGLGFGAQVVANRFRTAESWSVGLVGSQFLLGLVVFLSLPLWDHLTNVFSHGSHGFLQFDAWGLAIFGFGGIAYGRWKMGRRPHVRASRGKNSWQVELLLLGCVLALALTIFLKYGDDAILDARIGIQAPTLFIASELMRFLCAFFMLIVPAVLLGTGFPLLLNLYSASARAEQVGARVGGLYAGNTFGAILGSLLTGFFLIPLLGSQGTLRTLATCSMAAGLYFVFVLFPCFLLRRTAWCAAVCVVVAIGWVGIRNWDPRLLCSGSYVYFGAPAKVERVIYQREDVAGGMTSVVQNGSERTLLSNAKFQGNNSGEENSQIRFALIPMLFIRRPNRGLVIGLGTGQTLQTLSLFPFKEIDVAELAPQIAEAAKLWFADVNGGVLDHDPRVHLSIADGRNFLLLSREPYDAITIEVSSIWIDGEADLYNREFYELCRQHLGQQGVLQQWVQLHHMRTKDLLVILNTATRVFPHVALFVGPTQGVIIASNQPLEADFSQLQSWDGEPQVRDALDRIRVPTTESLLGDLMLYGDSMNKALAHLSETYHLRQDSESTDLRPYLEYETPKGNVYPVSTLLNNQSFLKEFRTSTLPPELAIRNVPSQDELNLLQAYVLAERHQTQEALDLLATVNGPTRFRAQEEISRLKPILASGLR
jgi:spermidine synthase